MASDIDGVINVLTFATQEISGHLTYDEWQSNTGGTRTDLGMHPNGHTPFGC